MTIDIDSVYSFRQLGMRDNQEDSRYPDQNIPESKCAAFAVCDGVGGCNAGEIASGVVCSTLCDFLSHAKNTDTFTDDDFKRILNQAYDALDKASNEENQGMGTTLTFLRLHSGGVFAAHIGDSRIYQIRPDEGIVYRSEDHSLVNSLLRSGNISPEQLKDHPKGNIITRCMGCLRDGRERDDATVVNITDIAPGDYFLLCTDGVSGIIDEDELTSLYSTEMSDEEKIKRLSHLCSNSCDNNTAIQIHIGFITIDPQEACESTDETRDIAESKSKTDTAKFSSTNSSVHEISVISSKFPSKIKAFFSKFFK